MLEGLSGHTDVLEELLLFGGHVETGMRGANKRGFKKKSLGQHCTVLLPLLFRFRDSYSTSTRSRAELLVGIPTSTAYLVGCAVLVLVQP